MLKLIEKYKCSEDLQCYCTLCHTTIKNCYDVEIDGIKHTIGKDCLDNQIKGTRTIINLNWLPDFVESPREFKRIYRAKI